MRLILLMLTAMVATGCAGGGSAERQEPFSDRADEALRDPFGYSPTFEKGGVSGGGLWELDKEAVRKDIESVFNP